eukprot:366566-Chlamydomonas_euryale.AAC.8
MATGQKVGASGSEAYVPSRAFHPKSGSVMMQRLRLYDEQADRLCFAYVVRAPASAYDLSLPSSVIADVEILFSISRWVVQSVKMKECSAMQCCKR